MSSNRCNLARFLLLGDGSQLSAKCMRGIGYVTSQLEWTSEEDAHEQQDDGGLNQT